MCNYLDKVGSTYYFRRAVPGDVRPVILTASGAARTEWKFSLGTKDRDAAKRLIPAHTVSTDAEIDAARHFRRSDPQEAAQPLSPHAEAIAAARWENALEGAEIVSREIAAQDRRHELAAEAMAFYGRRLAGSTAELPPRLRHFRYMLDEARAEGRLEAEKAAIHKADKHPVIERTDTVRNADKGMMLHAPTEADIVDLWAAERKPVQKGIDTHRAVARWFYDREGRIPVNLITRKHVLSFKDKLVAEGQSAANIIMKLSRLRTLLQWAFNNDHAAANVAEGITLKNTDKARNKRLPFDLPALKMIFEGPVHAGGARPAGGKGEAAYWLPLLALFTGARLEELGQLRPGDVRQMEYPDAEGVGRRGWFICLTEANDGEGDTTTRLKNAASERVVPVHPELNRLGFVDFAKAAAKANSARLFPMLKPNIYGRLSAKWGEWFSPYMRLTCGVTDKRMVFHSFRHTFKHYARSGSMLEGVQRQIMGHSPGDVANEYGNGYPLHQLVAGMAMYRVPGLAL
ncbi:MAG: site-specific integrase [Pseudomonadota bacterium]|nr:site-specific integrase [Pseudomonadota bacterium]